MVDGEVVSFENDSSNDLIAIYKRIEEHLQYLNKSIITENNEDDTDENK